MFKKQVQLWQALRDRHSLARHIRTLRIEWGRWYPGPYDFTGEGFEKRVGYIISNTRNLVHVEFVFHEIVDPTLLSDLVLRLTTLPVKPRVSWIDRGAYDDLSAIWDLILQHKDVLPVFKVDLVALSVKELGHMAKLPDLERLNIHARSDKGFGDSLHRHLDALRKLKKLTVIQSSFGDPLSTLPHNLRILRLHLDSRMSNTTWTAICVLRALEELSIWAQSAEEGPPCRFQSAKLRLFHYELHSSNSTGYQRASNVFKECHRLSRAIIGLPNPLTLFSKMPAIDSLSSLDLARGNFESSLTFQDIVDIAEKLPHLRYFTTWWPNDKSGRPERLTSSQAHCLAEAFTKLEEIEFRFIKSIWSEYKQWNDLQAHKSQMIQHSLPDNMLLNPIRFSSLGKPSQYPSLQSLDMHLLIDAISPCLHVCTAISKQPSVFLSLKQVRRHSGHLYYHPF